MPGSEYIILLPFYGVPAEFPGIEESLPVGERHLKQREEVYYEEDFKGHAVGMLRDYVSFGGVS